MPEEMLSVDAEERAEWVKLTFESQGFAVFWNAFITELQAQKSALLNMTFNAYRTPAEFAMRHAYQEGLIAGLLQVAAIRTNLIAYLKSGGELSKDRVADG